MRLKGVPNPPVFVKNAGLGRMPEDEAGRYPAFFTKQVGGCTVGDGKDIQKWIHKGKGKIYRCREGC